MFRWTPWPHSREVPVVVPCMILVVCNCMIPVIFAGAWAPSKHYAPYALHTILLQEGSFGLNSHRLCGMTRRPNAKETVNKKQGHNCQALTSSCSTAPDANLPFIEKPMKRWHRTQLEMRRDSKRNDPCNLVLDPSRTKSNHDTHTTCKKCVYKSIYVYIYIYWYWYACICVYIYIYILECMYNGDILKSRLRLSAYVYTYISRTNYCIQLNMPLCVYAARKEEQNKVKVK